MTYLTHGLVLKKDCLREYDVKYTIYTRSNGKISAVAKGAKKITSKLNSHLEFFMISKLMLADGRLVKRIAGAQVEKHFSNISNNLEKRIIALYFLEMIDLMVKYDFHDEAVFEILENFFISLNQGNNKKDDLICLNKFLYLLLEYLGYKPKIKSSSQRGLIAQLNKMAVNISEREVKSYHILHSVFS